MTGELACQENAAPPMCWHVSLALTNRIAHCIGIVPESVYHLSRLHQSLLLHRLTRAISNEITRPSESVMCIVLQPRRNSDQSQLMH